MVPFDIKIIFLYFFIPKNLNISNFPTQMSKKKKYFENVHSFGQYVEPKLHRCFDAELKYLWWDKLRSASSGICITLLRVCILQSWEILLNEKRREKVKKIAYCQNLKKKMTKTEEKAMCNTTKVTILHCMSCSLC